MYIYQYLIMATVCCLFIVPRLRYPAYIFVCSWITYYIFLINIIESPYEEYYFAGCALIEFFIGWALNPRFKLVSMFSYSLILVNFLGYALHYNDLDQFYYIVLYAIIETLRILVLIARGLLDGVDKSYWRLRFRFGANFLVRSIDFDGDETYVKMHKNTSIKKTLR